MSKTDFDNINYEQFEVSLNNERNISKKEKIQKIFQNKYLKIRLILLSLLFFILCIVLVLFYIKKTKEYNKLEKKVMDFIFFPYHSDLIPSLVILKKLKKYIQQIVYEKTGKNYKPYFKLYFKATIDGDTLFHNKTDKYKGYIILIKDEYENIFGGYTSKNFKGNSVLDIDYGTQKNDKISFLFNLDKDEIYPVISPNSDNHIFADIDEGPIFGESANSDLSIRKNFLSSKSYSNFPKNFNLNEDEITNGNNNKLRLTNGQKYFLIKELEAFRVILLN
jgi:hypothetical protein